MSLVPSVRCAILIALAFLGVGAMRAEAGFGLTTTDDLYTVDTGGGLIFSVRRTDPTGSLKSAGDLASLQFHGVEFQDAAKGSHVNSGLGAATVNATSIGESLIRIEVNDQEGLTHYYLARAGYPHIYMGTYFTVEPKMGLVRYIVRIAADRLPHGPEPSDIRHAVGPIEARDIFVMPDGTTRSKHYSNQRIMDCSYIGATGPEVGLWMVRDNYEGGSGGPFYRCLLNQCGEDQEITYVVNYGEAQTEPLRTGILNSYTLAFTTGAAPEAIDTSWFGEMNLKGYIAPRGRGAVKARVVAGRDTAPVYTIGFAGAKAQYWSPVQNNDGSFACTGMIPGDYAATIYKNELAVWTGRASVTAGEAHPLENIKITADPGTAQALWRIGIWDGTPNEFLNADKATTMHPSDKRIGTWAPGTFTVGVSSPKTGLPCYQWKEINSPQVIAFDLTPDQLMAHTLRVGITTACSGGRPRITMNSWTSPIPDTSDQPRSRTMTVGTYRGRNATFTFDIPASAFVVGTNILKIDVVSGSGSTGFLSAGFSYDCVDLLISSTRETMK